MEYFRRIDLPAINILRTQHLVGTRLPVEREGSVAAGIQMDESERRISLWRKQQPLHLNTALRKHFAQIITESVIPYRSDKGGAAAKLG